MGAEPFYRTRRMLGDRWAVCHPLPCGTLAVVVDCPNRETAEEEAIWRNAQRQRDQQQAAAALMARGECE